MRLLIFGAILGTALAWLYRRQLAGIGESGVETLTQAASPARERVEELTDRRPLEELTKEELYERAKQADIPRRSEMSKEQLIAALRDRA